MTNFGASGPGDQHGKQVPVPAEAVAIEEPVGLHAIKEPVGLQATTTNFATATTKPGPWLSAGTLRPVFVAGPADVTAESVHVATPQPAAAEKDDTPKPWLTAGSPRPVFVAGTADVAAAAERKMPP